MSSAPATLPITNPEGPAQPEAQISSSAFRSFLHRLTTTLRQSLSLRRPWSELLDRTAFSRPDSLSDAASRLRKNYTYFRINYLTLLTLILALSLLSHPFSLLLLLSLLAAWCFLYLFKPSDSPIVLAGRAFSDREVLGGLLLFTVVVVFLTSVGSLLISGVLVGTGIVCVHGAFRIPEDLFMDEQEGADRGFLSFLGGAATNAAVAAGTRV